jgi:hypothetical protein
MLDPLHCLHCFLWQSCCLQLLLWRLCSQMLDRPQSLHVILSVVLADARPAALLAAAPLAVVLADAHPAALLAPV